MSDEEKRYWLLHGRRSQIMSRISSGIITNEKTLKFKRRELELIEEEMDCLKEYVEK